MLKVLAGKVLSTVESKESKKVSLWSVAFELPDSIIRIEENTGVIVMKSGTVIQVNPEWRILSAMCFDSQYLKIVCTRT